jgi:hypothetical protein
VGWRGRRFRRPKLSSGVRFESRRAGPYLVGMLDLLAPATLPPAFSQTAAAQAVLFAFEPFLKKNTFRHLENVFPNLDPELGAVSHGAEVIRLSAMSHGAETPRAHHLAQSSTSWVVAPSSAPQIVAPSRLPYSTPIFPYPSLPPIFLTPSRFFRLSPTRPTSSIDVFDLENIDLIHRSSRASHPLSPHQFLPIDLIYIIYIIQCNCLSFRV